MLEKYQKQKSSDKKKDILQVQNKNRILESISLCKTHERFPLKTEIKPFVAIKCMNLLSILSGN